MCSAWILFQFVIQVKSTNSTPSMKKDAQDDDSFSPLYLLEDILENVMSKARIPNTDTSVVDLPTNIQFDNQTTEKKV